MSVFIRCVCWSVDQQKVVVSFSGFGIRVSWEVFFSLFSGRVCEGLLLILLLTVW